MAAEKLAATQEMKETEAFVEMKYMIERYKNCERFNEQYKDIYQFLLEASKQEYNEHFPWGRFEWMQNHTMLDENNLTGIAMFKEASGKIVGLATYDTSYEDRVYLVHLTSDRELLNEMVEYVLENEDDSVTIKVNAKDESLCELLQERRFVKEKRDVCVLQLDLNKDLSYRISDEYSISPQDFKVDNWKYQLVIHKGFNHEGVPERLEDKFFEPTPNDVSALKVFAIKGGDYCAHCGVWYTKGDTAYIEPVVTVPQHRQRGLAKAVVYEAVRRAKDLGANRATVLSDQEFYDRIGFEYSSEVYCWKK